MDERERISHDICIWIAVSVITAASQHRINFCRTWRIMMHTFQIRTYSRHLCFFPPGQAPSPFQRACQCFLTPSLLPRFLISRNSQQAVTVAPVALGSAGCVGDPRNLAREQPFVLVTSIMQDDCTPQFLVLRVERQLRRQVEPLLTQLFPKSQPSLRHFSLSISYC